jgi:hypothetical protein
MKIMKLLLIIVVIVLIEKCVSNTIKVANDINDNNNVTINHYNDYNETANQIDYNKTIIHVDPSNPVKATITPIDTLSNSNQNNTISNNQNNSIFFNPFNYFTKSSSTTKESSKMSLEDYTASGVSSSYPFYVTSSYMKIKAWEFLKG